MKLLRIDSSARRGSSVSRQLTDAFIEAWKREHPKNEVIVRDLAATTLPLLTDEWTKAASTSPDQRTAEQRQMLEISETLIDELVAADAIVIGAPMYNFTISSLLKAWIDQIVRPGKTVMYGPDGPRGLLAGKKVVVLTARGGAYADGAPRANYDFQETYLRQILDYIGLTDVTFIHTENQQRPDQARKSREAAMAQVAAFIASDMGSQEVAQV